MTTHPSPTTANATMVPGTETTQSPDVLERRDQGRRDERRRSHGHACPGPRDGLCRGVSRGFTLVEALVVIAIIGLLVSLITPAVAAARASVRRVECSNNLRQIGLAIVSYTSAYDHFPPATSATFEAGTPPYSRPRHGMVTFILPYLEQDNVSDSLNLDLHWNHAVNTPATQVDLPILICPSSPFGPERMWVSDYSAATRISNPATVSDVTTTRRGIRELIASGKIASRGDDFDPKWEGLLQPRFSVQGGELTESRIAPDGCIDGLSNTIMLVEGGGRPLEYDAKRRHIGTMIGAGHRWASPDNHFSIDYFCTPGQLANCTNQDEVYGFHNGGCNYVMGDGSVRYLQDSIDPEVFVCLITRAAEDVLNLGGL